VGVARRRSVSACRPNDPTPNDPSGNSTSYLGLSRDIIADTGVADDAADLPFRLVESLVNMWSGQRAPEPSTLPENVADACIRVLGVAGSAMPRLRTSTRRQLASHGADWSRAERPARYRTEPSPQDL
jgi:hypothetical protein